MDDLLVIREADVENDYVTTKYWLTQSAKEGSIKHIVSQIVKKVYIIILI